jgi:hypothetical protein
VPRVDAQLPPPPADVPADPPAYVYAATDIRPRQSREIELCEKASHFDWLYTGTFVIGFIGANYANIGYLKHTQEPGYRLTGAGLVGFTWGGILGGGYLSLPKCEPERAPSIPPEGDIRASWPMALAIAALSGITAPMVEATFLGPGKLEWTVAERSGRVFVGIGTGIAGSLFPYLVSPRPWAAKKEIEKLRVEGMPGGAMLGWRTTF